MSDQRPESSEERSRWESLFRGEKKGDNQSRRNRGMRFNFLYFLIAMFGVLLLQNMWISSMQTTEIPYNRFQELLQQEKVSEIVISEDRIRGKWLDDSGETPEEKKFVTARVDPELAEELDQYDIEYKQIIENTFFRDVLSWVVPIVIFFAIWMFLLRRLMNKGGMGGGLMSIGKSKAKIYMESDTKVTFEDVAGVDEAITELKEVVDFLKDPKSYGRLGGRMPKGVLLIGPPGTGKTLLAKAVAGEASVPFYSISGSEFVEMFVGVGAARVRDLFEQARKSAPCIIFVDELDALGRARSSHPGMGGHDEKEQTLNQLLSELDGFDSRTGLILLAATNRPEILDPALLRAGRFDRQILVDRPDKQGREDILKIHLKKVKTEKDVDIAHVAALTPGFTGADLANLVNEAALVATRRKAPSVSMADFTSAIERMVAGLEKRNRLMNPREKEIVAHHEMGHALAAAVLPGVDPVHKISIIPRGVGALGYTIQRPTEDRYLMTKDELDSKMSVLMGGRAAEELIFGHLSTGAADDIAKATDIARTMVTRYAMEKPLGPITFDRDSPGFLGPQQPEFKTRLYSEETAREIDIAVRKLVEEAYRRTRAVLEANRKTLEEGARALLQKETLTGEELREIFASVEKNGHSPRDNGEKPGEKRESAIR